MKENKIPSLEYMILTRLDSNYHKISGARDFADYLIRLLKGDYNATYGMRDASEWEVEGFNQMLDKIQRGIEMEIGNIWDCLTTLERLIKEVPERDV